MSVKIKCPICETTLVKDPGGLWGFIVLYCPNRNCDYRVHLLDD